MTNKTASKTITKAAQFAIDFKPTAKLINKKFSEIKTKQTAIDDARLTIAKELATMQEQCKQSHINFKKWVEANISQSWETVRKLLPIGTAENASEGEGVKLLEVMREKNKSANAALRAKQREEKAATKPAKPKRETKKQKKARLQAERAQAEKALHDAFLALDDDARIAFLMWAESQTVDTAA